MQGGPRPYLRLIPAICMRSFGTILDGIVAQEASDRVKAGVVVGQIAAQFLP